MTDRIFAIEVTGPYQTLVELSPAQWEASRKAYPRNFDRVTRTTAENWVRKGWTHETGLFINDDGDVVYAEAEG